MDGDPHDPTARPLSILLLEDSDIDAELVTTHLERGHFAFDVKRVSSRAAFERELELKPDLVLADYAIPGFDGLSALAMALERQPETPFIFVSGVVGEEFATHALQHGAADYVTKRNLRHLPLAVRRAVERAQERTRRVRVESALRASELSIKVALRASKLGSWEMNPQTREVTWDARCYAIYGVPSTTPMTFDKYLGIVHPDDRDRVTRATQRALTPQGLHEFSEQFRAITPEGELHWVESLGTALFEKGVCTSLVGVVRDITESKTTELALLNRTVSLQASVEQQALERHLLWRNSQDLLVVLGAGLRLRDVTPSWERLLGRTVDDAVGMPLALFVHPDDAERTLQAFSSNWPQGLIQFENRLLHQDGSYRWFSWTASPGDNGEFYANGRDVTAERLAAEQIRQVEEALRQAQKMEAIGQLTGGIAHDFNNLLAGIVGSLDIIKRRLDRQRYDDMDRFIDAALSSANRAASLTQRLLAFSRRQALDVRPTELKTVIHAMEELLRRSLGENVTLELIDGEDLWLGQTDANQLESAILNLAINARDAMPEGGKLVITTQNYRHEAAADGSEGLQPGDYVLVTVADTGDGMSQDVIAKAFDPFFTTKPIGQGTGLGLSMVYGFVKQSGGHVRIRSTLGVGTSMDIFLKRAETMPEVMPTDEAAPDLRAADGESVLVIEDDEAVRMLIVEVLRDLGYHSAEAQDARTALPFIESADKIDLIISDVGLPGLSGRKLADIARQHRPDVPILFVTGYAQGAERRDGFLGPGMDMMTKPFNNDELAARIRSMIVRPH